MGVGYLFGCLLSIVLWRFDRHAMFERFHEIIANKLEKKVYCNIFYLFFIAIVCFIVELVWHREFRNLLVTLLVIEISDTEAKGNSNRIGDKRQFYNKLSCIARGLVCGFIAPIFYIVILGNFGGVIYTLIYYIGFHSELFIFRFLNNLLNIIPSLITILILYTIYVPRNKTLRISFKGDFTGNVIRDPLINVYIISAYIEGVNFYYDVERKNVHYLKSYGIFSNKIDYMSIKDFSSLVYSICFVIFVTFWIYEAEIIKAILKS